MAHDPSSPLTGGVTGISVREDPRGHLVNLSLGSADREKALLMLQLGSFLSGVPEITRNYRFSQPDASISLKHSCPAPSGRTDTGQPPVPDILRILKVRRMPEAGGPWQSTLAHRVMCLAGRPSSLSCLVSAYSEEL